MYIEFSVLGHVQWKKIEFFFGPFSSLFHPLVWHSLPEAKNIFFFFKKSKHSWKKHSEKHCKDIEMSSPCPEDYYTPVAEMDTNHILTKKYAHGRESVAEGGLKNLLFLWF
jgi:hypothetical protein